MDRPVASSEANPSTAGRLSRRTVVSTHCGVKMCVDARRVVGCVQVERLARLPGSHDRIAGVLLFRGRPVPLVSIGRDSQRLRGQKRKTEEHVLVVSAQGVEIALRVDGVPEIVEGSPREMYAGSPCVMRTKHVERFIRVCINPGVESAWRARVPGRGSAFGG